MNDKVWWNTFDGGKYKISVLMVFTLFYSWNLVFSIFYIKYIYLLRYLFVFWNKIKKLAIKLTCHQEYIKNDIKPLINFF